MEQLRIFILLVIILLIGIAINIYNGYIYPWYKTRNMTEQDKNIWLENYFESLADTDME